MQQGGLVSYCFVAVLTIMWSTQVGQHAQQQTARSRITYSSCALREISHTIGDRPTLPNPLFKQLQSLNISRIKPRGNRAWRDKRDQFTNKPIPTVVSNRTTSSARIESRSVNLDNIRVIKPTSSGVKAAVINCRSVKNKSAALVDHIIDSNLDIIALTETWLSTDDRDQRIIGEITPPGYNFLQVPRLGKKGGGVAVLCRDNFKIQMKPSFKAKSFECMEVSITAISVTVKLIVIYRIPPNMKNGLKKSSFAHEFADMLEKVSIEPGKLLITGDFNIHWDNVNSAETKDISDLLSSYNLQQHVSESTHRDGHILDWVISRQDDNFVGACEVDSMLSDHCAIHFNLLCSKPHPPRKTVTFRNIKGIDTDSFKNDIRTSELYTTPASDVDAKVDQYNNVLKQVLDKHAPEKTKRFAERDNRPWMCDRISNAKKRRRRLERRWRRTKLTVHRQAYEEERDHVKNLIETEKSQYYNSKVEECEGDQKKLFNVVDKLLHKSKSTALPQHDNLETLANKFSDFFQDKIETIRCTLNDLEQTAEPLSCPPTSELLKPSDTLLDKFEPATQDEIMKIIKSSSKASCSLDPIPTRLLVDHFLPELLPVITDIVNSSLTSGIFPDSMKTALVRPLLKKLSLNPEIFKNFRPVSNLSFLSKIIEKVVANRLFQHMTANDLHDMMQSAYKPYHSTESALLRVQNDILSALDNKSGVFLALIDLSAAFDTVDHKILLDFLQNTIGVHGAAWNWFKSYLTGRSQQVSIESVVSEVAHLLYGVPQGSVLGPIKYCIYTLPIGAIIRSHGLQYSVYADDTQVYLSFDINDSDVALKKLNSCLSDIRTWMLHNKLKINDDKTEFLLLSSANLRSKMNSNHELNVGNASIPTSSTARNLGVIFDSHMTMDKHITSVCKSANFHLRNISSIRNVLTDSSASQLVHSMITSRLDYCNSLLIGIPDCQINRLQRIQNNAARVVSRVKKFDHISPILHSLHWLPVKERIHFKTMLLTYKALHGKAPVYLSELLTPYTPARQLRSGDKHLLTVPKSNTKTYGDRTFSIKAPRLWNDLPLEIRLSDSVDSFKRRLKTYLFKQAF